MELEKLICPKCGEEFPATTERGPGPAKATFAAHCNKCEGKKVEAAFSAEPAEPLKVGDQVMHGEDEQVMTIEKIEDGIVSCFWQEGGETVCDDFSLLDLFTRIPGTLEEVAQECAPVEVTAIKELCKVFLTDAEYKTYALQMAEAGRDISRAEDDLAAVKSKYKSRIDSAVARRNEISTIISMGWEDRHIECNLVKDYRAGEIYKVRLDTGEEIGRRAMNTDERQRGLDFMEKQAEAGEAGDA